jgi:phosphohistidine phosphatase
MSASLGRKLVLLRHAKSAWPDVPDHERPLARRGRRNALVMGSWMRAAGHLPDQVLCSTARRARETWQLVQPGLGVSPPVSFDAGIYEASSARLLTLIRRAPPAARTTLVVGHDPAVPQLAVTLAAPHGGTVSVAPPATFDHMPVKFPTAAAAVLEFTGTWDQLTPGSARLTCFVTPREFMARDRPGKITT